MSDPLQPAERIRIPLPPVPNVLKVLVGGFVDNLKQEVWANVLHFVFSGISPSTPTLNAIASRIATNWAAQMSAEQPSPSSLEAVRVTDLTSPTSNEGEDIVHVPGTRGDDSIPANVSALVSYPVNLRYQGGHFRTYLFVGGNADFQGATKWSAAFEQEYINHWGNFLNTIVNFSTGGTNITAMCGVSYIDKESNPTPPYRRQTPLVLPFDLSQMYAHSNVHTQRRRVKEIAPQAEAFLRTGRTRPQVNPPA